MTTLMKSKTKNTGGWLQLPDFGGPSAFSDFIPQQKSPIGKPVATTQPAQQAAIQPTAVQEPPLPADTATAKTRRRGRRGRTTTIFSDTEQLGG